jgi:hypothetical protein
MVSIAHAVSAIREDRRADYLFHTKSAADALNIHPNKFGDWWFRTREKLIDLYVACPGELAAELAALIAMAEAERQRRCCRDTSTSVSSSLPGLPADRRTGVRSSR